MKSFLLCFALSVLAARAVLAASAGEIQVQDEPLGTGPQEDWIAEIEIPGPRSITIYRQEKKPQGLNNIYYHRPIFAFEEAKDLINGFPPSVRKVRSTPDGGARLQFKVWTSWPEFRDKLCKDKILAADSSLRKGEDGASIHARRWPLTEATIDCRLVGEPTHLARDPTPSLKGAGDSWEFWRRFSKENLATFEANSGQDNIEFTFHYKFRGVQGEEANRAIIVTDRFAQDRLVRGSSA